MNAKEIIEQVRSEGRVLLSETESKELLKEAGIKVTDTRLARSKEEAMSMSDEMGYPVVLKIASHDITHKSDAGGVKLGVGTRAAVGAAYEEIMASVRQKFPAAKVEGVTVQKAARTGVEVIIGMSKDAQFGPVLMFGLGGIWVEILKDVSFRIVPLAKKDASSMIKEIKGYPLFEGRRGREAVEVSRLEEAVMGLSAFIEKHPEIKELDLNPIFAYSDGYVAVDARVILES